MNNDRALVDTTHIDRQRDINYTDTDRHTDTDTDTDIQTHRDRCSALWR